MTNINRKMPGDHTEMKDFASRICKDYLNGTWKCVNSKNIVFKHISGGLTNLLYHVSLPEYLEEKCQNEPKEVLLRIYGKTHGERGIENLITDSVIFTLLSERGLGPKLHGIFPGGRIEQYINARPLLNSELADKELSTQIAQKMAAIHEMEVPLHKEPSWLWNTINRWMKSCGTHIKSKEFQECLPNVNLEEEIVWLRNRVEMEKSPVAFCHNDLQEGNILICRDSERSGLKPKIIIIDFEYCSYNYRAFDIANHFVEWIYDYTEKQAPFFSKNMQNYPTEQQRLRFVTEYLKESGSEENPAKVLQEVEVFTLVSHIFWCLWSFVNQETSTIPFGYWEYGTSRLQSYFELKQQLSSRVTTKRKLEDTL